MTNFWMKYQELKISGKFFPPSNEKPALSVGETTYKPFFNIHFRNFSFVSDVANC